MTQIATVEKLIDATHAEIAVMRESACGHDCGGCAGCGGDARAVRAVARNRVNAVPGEKVVVESSTRKVMQIVFIVYVVPFVCFFAGYGAVRGLLQLGDGISGLFGAAAFLIGLLPALAYNRRVKASGSMQYDIIRRV